MDIVRLIRHGLTINIETDLLAISVTKMLDHYKFHLGCIADVDAVDSDGSEQEHTGQEHVDGQDHKNSEERKVPALIPDDFFMHRHLLHFQ